MFGGCDKAQNVMHHGRTARQNLADLHPFVFGEARIRLKVLILDHAGGRHAVRDLLDINDQVGLGRQAPTFHILARLGEIGRVAFRRAGRHPLINQFLLGVGQTAIVAEMAMFGVGVPGRHPSLANHFGDRVGPAGHFAVLRQREGTDLARPMAFHAAVLQDPCDLLRERDFAIVAWLANATDEAAHRIDMGRLHLFACQHLVDGLLQV